MKSYLAGNPPISLALNDRLAIGANEGGRGGGYAGGDVVMLDDCNFHEAVILDRFESERTLELVPPNGEFAVMNYRCAWYYSARSSNFLMNDWVDQELPRRTTSNFKPPFKVYLSVEEDPTSSYKVPNTMAAVTCIPASGKHSRAVQAVVYIKVRAEYAADKAASGMDITVPMPAEVQRVSCDYGAPPKPASSQSWDWNERMHRLIWRFKRLPGGSEHTLKVSPAASPPMD